LFIFPRRVFAKFQVSLRLQLPDTATDKSGIARDIAWTKQQWQCSRFVYESSFFHIFRHQTPASLLI